MMGSCEEIIQTKSSFDEVGAEYNMISDDKPSQMSALSNWVTVVLQLHPFITTI